MKRPEELGQGDTKYIIFYLQVDEKRSLGHLPAELQVNTRTACPQRHVQGVAGFQLLARYITPLLMSTEPGGYI
jgi:hypothetical protein